ncbi:type II toxin-antitoxin system Phd/YefM family antitoxin [Rhodovarius lipocyclicus]|jgi:hypothetical protein|uniref:type II toxin-antitoxin system Phd/YefM family antitoxin n=1 Tax=Rhodovarius lipocyclicus TaxID=268410 RepID=UPI001357FF20|nr:type II toxin-antitoxin system Phd/YefM family antitoxin [Rhodovarius lipocyclicus]
MAHPDDPLRPTRPGDPGEGLENFPRADIAVIEASQPKLVDACLQGPVVLTRHGRDAFVMLPVDQFQRLALLAEPFRLAGPFTIEGEKPG